MNIHEFQAKQLLREYAAPIPDGIVATTPEQAMQATLSIPSAAWAVKAQIHAGARGKAGGVKLAQDSQQVADISKELLGKQLVTHQTGPAGLPVNQVLIEAVTPIAHEYYLSLVLDRTLERLVFIAAAAGGMDIEETAIKAPEQIIRVPVHPAAGLQAYQSRLIAATFAFDKDKQAQLQQLMTSMYTLFIDKDATQIEINPLIETQSGQLLVLDAKINFDDNAVAFHPDIMALRDVSQEDAQEAVAKEHDLNYITLGGDIGCMVNGAGLAMATMDLVKLKGGSPANFLDVGGGATKDRVKEAFKLILADGTVKAVLVNIFGGIVQCDIIAAGILAAVAEMHLSIPVVVRLEGTNAEQGLAMLSNSGLGLYTANDLNTAAAKVVALAEVA